MTGGPIVHLTDERATARGCRRSLCRMLRRTGPGDVFFLYLGGHGLPYRFCAYDDEDDENEDEDKNGLCGSSSHWRFEDVVSDLESGFRGEAVWTFVDCCYSGEARIEITSRIRGGDDCRFATLI